MAVRSGQRKLPHVAGSIQDAQFRSGASNAGGDLRAETASGQPQVEDREVRLVEDGERDPLGDRPGDATHFVTSVHQNFFRHVGDHQIILGNQHFEQPAALREASQPPRRPYGSHTASDGHGWRPASVCGGNASDAAHLAGTIRLRQPR